ncbi:hypothetical protein J4225_00055 [Candidatus Pacearchaeota archaeon]|nr:hypothetical protein [Candidatus Pacearchaeota archaeon]
MAEYPSPSNLPTDSEMIRGTSRLEKIAIFGGAVVLSVIGTGIAVIAGYGIYKLAGPIIDKIF